MGVEMKVIQEILGHSNIFITADIYAHASIGMQMLAMDKWDHILKAHIPQFRITFF
jgi:site-specific recombinase XerD